MGFLPAAWRFGPFVYGTFAPPEEVHSLSDVLVCKLPLDDVLDVYEYLLGVFTIAPSGTALAACRWHIKTGGVLHAIGRIGRYEASLSHGAWLCSSGISVCGRAWPCPSQGVPSFYSRVTRLDKTERDDVCCG